MTQPKPFHLKQPVNQRTVSTKAATFYLDQDALLYMTTKPGGAVYSLTAVEVLTLYNMLTIFRADIITEARSQQAVQDKREDKAVREEVARVQSGFYH